MEQIKLLQPPPGLREAMEQMKTLQPPPGLREAMEQMKTLQPPLGLRQAMEQMKPLQFPPGLREAMEQIKTLQAPAGLREAIEQMKLFEPPRRLQEQLATFLDPHRSLTAQTARYIQPLSEYLSDPLIRSIDIDESGSIVVGNEVITAEAIREAVDTFSGTSGAGAEFIEAFFQWLGSIGRVARAVVIYVLFPYFLAIIANLSTPIYEDWWKALRDTEPRVAKKELVVTAEEFYLPHELRDHRFVSTKILYVRQSPGQSSEIVDELHLGKTVRLLEKSKSWSHIEYYDNDTKTLNTGWVFSRYIAKFEK